MAESPYYDLMVLLDPDSPEPQRSQVIDQVRSQVSTGSGALKGDADWGLRKLAYEIDHRPEAYYHLFQFQAPANLLEQLDRSLSIEDAVLRHRIIRLSSEPPEVVPRPEPTGTPVSTPEPDAAAETETPAQAPAADAPPVTESATPAETPAGLPEQTPAEPAAEVPVEAPPAGEETAPTPEPAPDSPPSEQ